MRRTETGIPYLSFVLSVRNSEAIIGRCLKSIRERCPQAEIVVVDNMSRDNTMEVAREWADVVESYAGPAGTWTPEDEHTWDMAASRNRAFSLASGRWRCWIDDDDRLPGPEESAKLLKLNAQWKPPGDRVEDAHQEPVGLEDLLREVEEKYPAADCVYAPYLYCKEDSGASLIWQVRERIIKWSDPPRWAWAEKAHEILCPVDGYKPTVRIDFAHLLFVHERDFSEKSLAFSITRHWNVLIKQYNEGEITTRRALYLAAYSRTIAPEREREFVDAAHAAATTPLDRYRSLCARGQLLVNQGLFQDAKEAYGAATHLRPDLPDAWIQGAEAWSSIEDWGLAANWYEKALECRPGSMESYVTPRFHVIRYPTLLSMAYEKIATIHQKAGNFADAHAYLRRATEILEKVRDNPAVGEDLREANCRRMRMNNACLAQASAIGIGNIADYLIKNDEPKKALELLKAVPWNVQDHPIVVSLERKLAPVARHLSDPKAYQEFYESDTETGYVASPEEWLNPAEGSLARLRWISNWLNTYAPTASILDVGCFDGIIGIPLLAACPGIKYVGIDIYQKSVDKFRERIAERGYQDRAQVFRMDSVDGLSKNLGPFDVAMWFEVIEHVPDPAAEMRRILAHLRPGGQLFITTPFGSFDAGHPPEKTDHGTPRDSRGHVRAMTPRDVVQVFDQAGAEIEDLEHYRMADEGIGDGLHAHGSNRKGPAGLSPVSFAVAGALWDWSGRTVHQEGMGASEKAIVQIGEALAGDYRRVEVYGPVPEADVCRGVRYWPREQLRHVTEGKIIVSRAPNHGKHLDDNVLRKPVPKILWLQDAYYPDLNPEVAARYEKIVVVSNWHKEAMNELHGVPLEKMEVIYNPVDPRLYTVPNKPTRKKNHFVYCSSPDRGLIPLLKLWPRIREALPGATLEIFYGFRGAQRLGSGSSSAWTRKYESCRRDFERLKLQPGITVRGMVDPVTLSRSFLSAGVWAYPVIDFTETCCTAALEARAAGCVPVAPPLAALTETARCRQGFMTPLASSGDWEDYFVEACMFASKVHDEDRELMAREAMERYSVEAMLPKWRQLLDG